MSVWLLVEKVGRSSKFRTKSPCSPQTVGVADADAEVALLATEALDEVDVKPLVVVVLKEADMVGAEIELETNEAVEDGDAGSPLAREVPNIEIKEVLGVAELEGMVVL
jgi:hypothetical protein